MDGTRRGRRDWQKEPLCGCGLLMENSWLSIVPFLILDFFALATLNY